MYPRNWRCYTMGWNISFADLLRRYLLEAPRLKRFETFA